MALNKREIILSIVTLVAVGAAAVLLWKTGSKSDDTITSFNECVNAGHPVTESQPRQCRTPSGQVFTEEIDDNGSQQNQNQDGQNNGSIQGESITLAGGQVSLSYGQDFGLAISQEQLLATSTVPACEPGFGYCLYYLADTYENTNFESAGVGINLRADLATEQRCLNTQPAGYSSLQPEVSRSNGYATSIFSPLNNAGAGHASTGELYRLAAGTRCYEFETRIAHAQLANFEPGTVSEFTAADRAVVEAKLGEIMASVRLEIDGAETHPFR